MCLYIHTTDRLGKIAEKSIKCYKILWKWEGPIFPKYRTPIQLCPIDLGETYNAYGEPDLYYLNGFEHRYYGMGVGAGTIHTFKDKKGAMRFIQEYRTDYFLNDYDLVIVPCTIPKGTKYFEGAFENTGIESYASTKLRYGTKEVYSVAKSPRDE